MKTNQNIRIHNRFDIEVRDVITGDLKQIAYAENIMLDQAWAPIINGASNGWFQYIFFGTGTGTLAASRTAMFAYLGGKNATTPEWTLDHDSGFVSHRKQISILEMENIGDVLTEVGIAWDSSASALATHALLKDMNGNGVSITKTGTDIITIFATVYVMAGATTDNFFKWQNGTVKLYTKYPTYIPVRTELGAEYDQIFCSLAGGVEQLGLGSGAGHYAYLLFSNSRAKRYRDQITYVEYPSNVWNTAFQALIDAKITKSVANKTISFYARLPAASFNATDGIRAVFYVDTYFSSYTERDVSMPIKVEGFTSDIVLEAVGTGNGSNQDFATAFPFVQSGAVIKVDGTVISSGVTVATNTPKDADISNVMNDLQYDVYGVFELPIHDRQWTAQEFIWENPFYATVPIKTMKVGTNTRILVSDDLANWDLELTSDNDATVQNISTPNQGKRYWKAASPANGTSASNPCVSEISNADYAAYKNIHFDTAPANGAVITADYTCGVWAKDANHVLDITITLTLADGTPA